MEAVVDRDAAQWEIDERTRQEMWASERLPRSRRAPLATFLALVASARATAARRREAREESMLKA